MKLGPCNSRTRGATKKKNPARTPFRRERGSGRWWWGGWGGLARISRQIGGECSVVSLNPCTPRGEYRSVELTSTQGQLPGLRRSKQLRVNIYGGGEDARPVSSFPWFQLCRPQQQGCIFLPRGLHFSDTGLQAAKQVSWIQRRQRAWTLCHEL